MKLKLSSTQLMWVALYINLHTVHEHSACVGTAFFMLRWASAILISESKNYLKNNQVTSTLYLNKVFSFVSYWGSKGCAMRNKKALWKLRAGMLPNDSWFSKLHVGMSKILWNLGLPAFIEMINIQQSNYLLSINDLLSTEHGPALLGSAEVCSTDLKRKKRKKKVLSVVRKY